MMPPLVRDPAKTIDPLVLRTLNEMRRYIDFREGRLEKAADQRFVTASDLAAAIQAVQIPVERVVGECIPYGGTTEPPGYLLCFGQAVSRTTYAALFAVIGTTFGAGDGSTTFNIPDIRGRVIAGQDDMGGTSANRLTGASGGVNGDNLGAAGGAETHTISEAQLAPHGHTERNRNNNNFASGTAGALNTVAQDAIGDTPNGVTTANAGSGSAHNNVQPTIILNYLIFTGV